MKALLALLLFTGSAFAAENGSEYQHQAPANVPELTPALKFTGQNIKFKNGDKYESGGFGSSVAFEYGLNDMFSVGAQLAANVVVTKKTAATGTFSDDSDTQRGLEDLKLFFQGRAGRAVSLRYGLDFNVALAKAKLESNGDTNAFSGGIGTTPFVGIEWVIGRNTFGARAEYKYWLTPRKGDVEAVGNTAAYSYKGYGGNTFDATVFYEADVSIVTIGGALSLKYQNDRDQRRDGQTISRSTGTSGWDFEVYVPVHVTPTITILPKIDVGQITAFDNTGGIDTITMSGFQVAGRFAF